MKRGKLAILLAALLTFTISTAGYSKIEWVRLADLNERKNAVDAVVLNGKIYVLGGHRAYGNYLNTCEAYDPLSNSWTYINSMHVSRALPTAQVYNGKIYIFGGKDQGTGDTNTVEIFDPANNNWTFGTPMSITKHDISSAIIGNEIYVIAGGSYSVPERVITNLDVYSFSSDQWRSETPLNTGKAGRVTVFLDNKFYAIGGNFWGEPGGEALVEVYDIATGTWTDGPSLNIGRAYHACTVYKNKIYVFGGTGTEANSWLDTIEVFDPKKGFWEFENSKMTTPRAWAKAIVLNDEIYLIGGRDSTNAEINLVEKGIVNSQPIAEVGGPYLGPARSEIQFDGTGSNDPDNDPLTFTWDFGDGNSGSGPTPTNIYDAAGIYDVCLTVDDGYFSSEEVCTYVVVYDPSAGFVTGGGWIDSPEGAYIQNPTLNGKANFGFVSKYLKDQITPSGNTQFQFQTADLSFHSNSYDWLVVTGSNYAKFKGTGTINSEPAPNAEYYKFMVWAGDDASDTFRIKIWFEDNGIENIIYDNGMDQVIGGGSIIIHTQKNK